MAHTDVEQQRNILQSVADIPNLITLANVVVWFFSIVCLLGYNYEISLVLLFTAFFLDHVDGFLARRQNPKNMVARNIGQHLDSFSDLLNFGIIPAVFSYMISQGQLVGIVSALCILLSSVIRLSYFNVHGLDNGAFTGLPTTFAAFFFGIAAWLVLLAGPALVPLLLLFTVVLAIAEISPVRLRKPTYPIRYAFIAALVMSALVLTT